VLGAHVALAIDLRKLTKTPRVIVDVTRAQEDAALRSRERLYRISQSTRLIYYQQAITRLVLGSVESGPRQEFHLPGGSITILIHTLLLNTKID
jgi:hypothetical protein